MKIFKLSRLKKIKLRRDLELFKKTLQLMDTILLGLVEYVVIIKHTMLVVRVQYLMLSMLSDLSDGQEQLPYQDVENFVVST